MLSEALLDALKKNFVSDSIKEERLKKCSECEHKKVILGVENCDMCKCILNWKTAMPRESCPVGLWSVVEAIK